MQQETLTQMNFVSQEAQYIDLDTEDEDQTGDEEATDIDPPEDEVVEKPKSKSRSKSKFKPSSSKDSRRRTMGDQLDPVQKSRSSKRRKTMGDTPSMSISSSFHTQTLTQFLSNKDEDEEPLLIDDSEAEADDDFGLVMETPTKPRDGRPPSEGGEAASANNQLDQATGSQRSKLATPKRTTKTEIPSSESPAITPMLMRYSPLGKRKSPLQGKSTNVDAPSPILRSAHKRSRDLVIQDTYSTVDSSPTTVGTPTPKATTKFGTPKRLRFEIPDNKENITPGRTKPKSPKPLRKTPARPPLREVPDSDAEDEESVAAFDTDAEVSESTDVPPESPTPLRRAAEPESYYGHIGEETQAEILSSDHLQDRDPEPENYTPKAASNSAVMEAVAETPSKSPCLDIPEHDRPANPIVEESPIAAPPAPAADETEESGMTQGPADTQYTQGLESQRLSLEDIHAMGPQTLRSDIMVSLHPEHLSKIVDGTKNHEFRVWKIPAEVSRVWLYATKPVSELRYMCVFGPPKAPGEVEDEQGAGNRAFNHGKTVNKYAYEVLQVYELNDPVSLQEMLRKGWVKGAPQKYNYVPPAVVGALTANLRCALFAEGEEPEAEAEAEAGEVVSPAGGPPASSAKHVTESQEIREQIQTDVAYSTQHPSSDLGHLEATAAVVEDEEEDEIIPSSQTDLPRKGPSPKRGARNAANPGEDAGGGGTFAKPSLPNTSPATQGQGRGQETQSQRRSQREREKQSSYVRPSQATTVTQMSSSPAGDRRTDGGGGSGSGSRHHQNHYHHHHHSLRSSQFLTRSQMLPDSLLNDETREPPPIIWDSADEESD